MGNRIRVYCTHPLEFNGRYITEMTEGELGSSMRMKTQILT